MKEQKFQEIGAGVAGLAAQLSSTARSLREIQSDNGDPFDLDSKIPGTNESVSEILSRMVALSGTLEQIEHSDLVPDAVIDNAVSKLNAVTAACQQLEQQGVSSVKSHGGSKSINYENFHVACNDGQAVNVAPQFVNLRSKVEDLLSAYHALVTPLGIRGLKSYQSATKMLSDIFNELSAELDSVQRLHKDFGEKYDAIEVHLEQASQFRHEVERLKNEAGGDRKSVTEYTAEVTEKLVAAREVSEGASQLQTEVENFSGSFQSFQKSLDSREEQYAKTKNFLTELQDEFEGYRKDVDDNISRSEEMLSSATVAGLASHFATLRERKTTELNSARTAFYFGIGLLLLTSLPLFAFIALPVLAALLPGVVTDISALGARADADSLYYFSQVVGRLMLLLPAAWYVRFASQRHNKLFRLREDYDYKYSMAVSVEGFKIQAPGYSEEIAAGVLEQLSFNPAERMDFRKDENDSPSPILSHVLKKMQGSGNEA